MVDLRAVDLGAGQEAGAAENRRAHVEEVEAGEFVADVEVGLDGLGAFCTIQPEGGSREDHNGHSIVDARDWRAEDLVDPISGGEELPAAGSCNIGEFDADGWHIQYVSWQQNDQSVYPKRIDLARNSLRLKQLKLRIIIDHWEPR